MHQEASHVDLLILQSAGEGFPYVTSIFVNAPVCLIAQDLSHNTRICRRMSKLKKAGVQGPTQQNIMQADHGKWFYRQDCLANMPILKAQIKQLATHKTSVAMHTELARMCK